MTTSLQAVAARDAETERSTPPLVVTEGPLPALTELASTWSNLEARATASFFLSWTWMGTWLSTLEESGYPMAALRLLTAQRAGEVVGLAVIGTSKRAAIFPFAPIALNQSGDPRHDSMYIEYNDVLAATSVAGEARVACLTFVRRRWPWRRLHIQAAGVDLQTAMTESALIWRASRTETCAYADLSAAPPAEDTFRQFLGMLSANTRQQIMRARKRAEQIGPLTVSRARPDEAEPYFTELVTLHDAAWRARKQRNGAFANPVAKRFVQKLLRNAAAAGTVELLRMQAGAQTIGVLLNFVWRGAAYSYQSGFAYGTDNRDKPGLLCHALAAADYIQRGIRAYHFMAGEGQYKKSLSNATEVLTWIETYPNETIARVEDVARTLWRKIRRTARTRPADAS